MRNRKVDKDNKVRDSMLDELRHTIALNRTARDETAAYEKRKADEKANEDRIMRRMNG